MEYTLEITETLKKKVKVEASSYKDARKKVDEMYNDEQIVLSADDFYGYEIEPLP